jgi:hypothetical protein
MKVSVLQPQSLHEPEHHDRQHDPFTELARDVAHLLSLNTASTRTTLARMVNSIGGNLLSLHQQAGLFVEELAPSSTCSGSHLVDHARRPRSPCMISDSPTGPVHAFFGARVGEFVALSAEAVVGALTTRAALEFRGNQPEQARAWRDQVAVLQRAFDGMAGSQDWGLLLEYSLRRLGRRPDAVILAPGVTMVVEFKMGADGYDQSYIDQAQDYALCIRDFHRAGLRQVLVPIVCAEHATERTEHVPSVIDSSRDHPHQRHLSP